MGVKRRSSKKHSKKSSKKRSNLRTKSRRRLRNKSKRNLNIKSGNKKIQFVNRRMSGGTDAAAFTLSSTSIAVTT